MTRSIARKLLIVVVALGVAGVLAGAGTYSALSSTTSNTGNSFAAGTVALSDNDGGTSKLFTLSNLKPTTPTQSNCIVVTYNGSVTSNVRLYGTTTGTGLDQYLTLKVTRGTKGVNTAFDCTSFTADATNYIGQGAGVIYSGTLQNFADDFNSGLVDPTSGSPEDWTSGENHAYKFEVTLQNNAAAQGLNATQDFTWEARNK